MKHTSRLSIPHWLVVGAALGMTACLPAALDKYRNKDRAADDQSMTHPGADIQGPAPESSYSAKRTATKRRSHKEDRGPQATIYAVDKRTFRFLMKEGEVWSGAIDVLLRNYNLNIVDKNTGIITTEWDSYYLNNSVYRNKVSLRINRQSYNVVDVTIHNNVEKLRDAPQAAGTVGAVWLPADDEAGELARIVQNMALILNQPPPVLPPGVEVAKDAIGQEIQQKR